MSDKVNNVRSFNHQQALGKTSIQLPEHELEAIARCIYPAIVEFFQSEEGQKEFADWKAQQVDIPTT